MLPETAPILPPGYQLSTDPAAVPIKQTAALLRTTAWAADMSAPALKAVLGYSWVATALFGPQAQLAGFGRVISDTRTFAYLTDLIVDPGHRGQGLAKALTRTLLGLQALRAVPHWALLAASDEVKGLYEQEGFARTPHQHAWLERFVGLT